MFKWDVVIAGAGPAGAVAAHILAQSRHRVLLADNVEPNDHKVGEALTGAAARLLRSINLPILGPNEPHTRIGGNLSSWNSDELVATDFLHDPDGPGWRLDRARFDAKLRESARQSGSALISSHVRNVQRQGTYWQVGFANGKTTQARWLIDATGRRAALARRLGARRLRDTGLVAIYGLSKRTSEVYSNRTFIEAVRQGWWYSAWLPSGAPIAGIHLSPDDAAPIAKSFPAWRRALANTKHISKVFADVNFERMLSPMEACGSYLDRSSGEGWIACGDAALSFDPLSGQGIYSALYGGMTVGRALVAALACDTSAIYAYDERLAKIRRSYLSKWRSAYASETKWLTEPFWVNRAVETFRSEHSTSALPRLPHRRNNAYVGDEGTEGRAQLNDRYSVVTHSSNSV